MFFNSNPFENNNAALARTSLFRVDYRSFRSPSHCWNIHQLNSGRRCHTNLIDYEGVTDIQHGAHNDLYPEPGSKTSKNPSSWGNMVFKRNLYPTCTGWMEYDVVRVLNNDPVVFYFYITIRSIVHTVYLYFQTFSHSFITHERIKKLEKISSSFVGAKSCQRRYLAEVCTRKPNKHFDGDTSPVTPGVSKRGRFDAVKNGEGTIQKGLPGLSEKETLWVENSLFFRSNFVFF